MFFLLLVILIVTVLCQSVDQLHKDLIINEAALCETRHVDDVIRPTHPAVERQITVYS